MPDRRQPLAHPAAGEPVGLEQLVEALPFLLPAGQQHAQRAAHAGRILCALPAQQIERGQRLAGTDPEVVAAQVADEADHALGNASHAAWPARRAVTSRGHRLGIALGLEQADQARLQLRRIALEPFDAEPDQGCRPVERLGDARHLLQVLLAQRLDEARDLAGERRLDARQRAPG